MDNSTADTTNDAFYTKLAHSWWDKDGPLWPIHTLNRVRVAYLTQAMLEHFALDNDGVRPLRGLRILDIGCGGGVLSESMAQLGAVVTAIDVVERNIIVARMHAQQQSLDIDYRVSSAEELLPSGQTYDVVLNMEVVEHVSNLPLFMQSCSELLKPGGLMFIATINRNLISWFSAIVAAEYILGWLPRNTHQWRKFRKPQELQQLLHMHGLQVQDHAGVLVNPFNRKMRLTLVTLINYMLVAAKEQQTEAN